MVSLAIVITIFYYYSRRTIPVSEQAVKESLLKEKFSEPAPKPLISGLTLSSGIKQKIPETGTPDTDQIYFESDAGDYEEDHELKHDSIKSLIEKGEFSKAAIKHITDLFESSKTIQNESEKHKFIMNQHIQRYTNMPELAKSLIFAYSVLESALKIKNKDVCLNILTDMYSNHQDFVEKNSACFEALSDFTFSNFTGTDTELMKKCNLEDKDGLWKERFSIVNSID